MVTLCIHGGLNRRQDLEGRVEEYRQSMQRIVTSAYAFAQSHTAVETAVYAVSLLEDDPLLNAGTGSTIQSDGVIRMSASLMDGANHIFSGVMNIESVRNPIQVAAALQKEKDRVLAGAPAQAYARALGMGPYNPETPERRAAFERRKSERPTSTVGCVVLDAQGNLAAATSTGGKGWEIPGRVGDSPTIAGNFANQYGAVSATGTGEDIINVGLACALATRLADHVGLLTASEKAVQELSGINGSAGFIAINRTGEVIARASEPCLIWASASESGISLFSYP